MRGRIRQRIDDLEELDHRARPTVRDDDRQRVRVRRADVQEVNVEAVDLGAILVEAVQRRLAAPPVVARPPVLHERAQLGERHALRPIRDRLAFRPARVRQALPQIVEGALRRVIAEGSDGGTRGCAPYVPEPGRGDGRCGASLQHRAARHSRGRRCVARFRSRLCLHDPCSRLSRSAIRGPRHAG